MRGCCCFAGYDSLADFSKASRRSGQLTSFGDIGSKWSLTVLLYIALCGSFRGLVKCGLSRSGFGRGLRSFIRIVVCTG